MSAATFVLTFAPERSEDGYRWTDTPRVLIVGRYADTAREWRRQLRGMRVLGDHDPRTCRLGGRGIPGGAIVGSWTSDAALSARFGVHVIGRGTLTIAEVSS